MEKKKNYPNLKQFARDLGADLFGVADIAQIKKDFMISSRLLEKLNSAVCIGMRLSAGVLAEIETHPTRLYFHHYKTTNAALDQAALKIAAFIQRKGYLSLPVPASQIVDWQNQKAHLSHKKIGELAGLGWIGRNNLLVNKKFGSQFRLVTILSNMPLKIDKPVVSACADCRMCIAACPCGAIKEEVSAFDYRACFEKLKEFQKQRFVDQYICGVCLKVCTGKKGAK
jgi:epoxyqueuosine reductase QueG